MMQSPDCVRRTSSSSGAKRMPRISTSGRTSRSVASSAPMRMPRVSTSGRTSRSVASSASDPSVRRCCLCNAPASCLLTKLTRVTLTCQTIFYTSSRRGRFEIPELIRIVDEIEKIKVMPLDGAREEDRVEIIRGRVRCEAFPFVLITSNGERELPPAFNRRCLRLALEDADRKRLEAIIKSHLGQLDTAVRDKLIDDFVKKQDNKELIATDQLLNTLFLITRKPVPDADKQKDLIKMLMEKLG